MNKEKLALIFSQLETRVDALGYDYVGTELVRENSMDILRVYLEIPNGVDLNDCETVARDITEYLDTVESCLPDNYFLEVSSPGLERPLFSQADYRKFSGHEALLLVKGNKTIQGIILQTEEDGIVSIETQDGVRVVELADIRRGKLVYKKETGQKKTFKKIPPKKNKK